ncbi:MAG: heavy metal-responsive transcriptional regulator [Colwellia sp.]|nr:heavy metal-responsive transcriptional regulator [Colwellia sp.]
MFKISEVVKQCAISADTLRYYEKIQLLPPIHRNDSGIRLYNKQDISSISFIKRAQYMGFSLAEIAKLLAFRKDPQHAKTEVRQLANDKLIAINEHLSQLKTLKNELTLLVNLCNAADDGCPIIKGLEIP